jgi:hypothetical protein
VRTRIYFTSESHIHSLVNVLRYCNMAQTWGVSRPSISRSTSTMPGRRSVDEAAGLPRGFGSMPSMQHAGGASMRHTVSEPRLTPQPGQVPGGSEQHASGGPLASQHTGPLPAVPERPGAASPDLWPADAPKAGSAGAAAAGQAAAAAGAGGVPLSEADFVARRRSSSNSEMGAWPAGLMGCCTCWADGLLLLGVSCCWPWLLGCSLLQGRLGCACSTCHCSSLVCYDRHGWCHV